MTVEPFVFVPAEQTQVEFVPGASNTTLAVPADAKSGGHARRLPDGLAPPGLTPACAR